MKILEMQVKNQAQKAVDYFAKNTKQKGGNKLRHKTNAYGIALKYIFAIRDMTYENVAEKLSMTPQNVNHIVNRAKKRYFDMFTVEKLCRKLSVDSAYFTDLVKEIDDILEA